ncbi:MAG: hypothetical protein R2867_23000 [Caldilineaceae bacterium]
MAVPIRRRRPPVRIQRRRPRLRMQRPTLRGRPTVQRAIVHRAASDHATKTDA